jgi:hypothetical protein
MVRVALLATATALLALVLVPAGGADKDWREAVPQAVERRGRGLQTWPDYTVVDGLTDAQDADRTVRRRRTRASDGVGGGPDASRADRCRIAAAQR